MALRAIPNLWYVRPGDANETAAGVADRARARRRPGRARPVAPEGADARLCPTDGALRGAYVLWQSGDGLPDLILIATGSEVGVALEAAKSMDANVRVVSMPCWELFEEQPQDYRDEVLPPDVRARLSVEAGISLGWERWVGDAGWVGRDRPLRRVGSRRRGAGAARLHGRERGDARGGAARAGRMKIVVAFDHRGVKLRERLLEELDALAARGGRPRHGHRRRADRLPGQGARAGRGDPARRRGARRARLRLRGRRLRRRLQDARDPRRDLPRRLLRPPGRRARRHERALPRLRGDRRASSPSTSSAPSSARASTAASATWRG